MASGVRPQSKYGLGRLLFCFLPLKRGVQPLAASRTSFGGIIYSPSFMAAKLGFQSTFAFQRRECFPRSETGRVKFKRCNFLHCFAWGEDVNADFGSSHSPLLNPLNLKALAVGGSGFLRFLLPFGGRIVSSFVSFRHLWSPPTHPPCVSGE